MKEFIFGNWMGFAAGVAVTYFWSGVIYPWIKSKTSSAVNDVEKKL